MASKESNQIYIYIYTILSKETETSFTLYNRTKEDSIKQNL